MSSKFWAIVMAALLVLYLVLVAQLAWRLFLVDEAVAKALGVALIILPIVGMWALVVEFIFGTRSERLGRELAAESELPMVDLPRLASGRVLRSAADGVFGAYQAEVEAQPNRWQSWYRLGLVYDACGDRRRARGALRKAIAVSRSDRSPTK